MPALRPSGGGEAALNLRRRGSRWPGTMGEPFQGSVDPGPGALGTGMGESLRGGAAICFAFLRMQNSV